MKQARIVVYIDLIFCLVILPLILMLAPVEKLMIYHIDFGVTMIVYLYLLYFVYRKTNIPSLFMRRRFGHILLLIAVLLVVTELVSKFPLPDNHLSSLPIDFRRHLRSQMVWFLFLIVTGFSLTIEVAFELFRQILSKQQIESEKNKAELALYKAQINPHFLFNTLNALYGLVITKSDRTESAFIKFSNILRYMYTNTTSETIAIDNEIDYIRQYVDLQSLRINNHTNVVFESRADDGQIRIPPMILITFVENAFKYGISPDEDCTIVIRIIVEKGCLFFETENTVMRKKQDADADSSIGIENCRKRLNLLYPDRFTLAATEENSRFKIRLIIRLQ